MAYSSTDISNRALQKLGAKRITSLADGTSNARACAACFTPVLEAELRKHAWNEAIERAELAADATEPDWGRANSFTLPADFIRLLPAYPEDNTNTQDWQIEGNKILTNDAAPIYIRYIKSISSFRDPLLVEAVAAKMAIEMCEEITQSNAKKADAREDYKDAIREAKKMNSFENESPTPPEDVWLTVRD